jgi:hypothetical protein
MFVIFNINNFYMQKWILVLILLDITSIANAQKTRLTGNIANTTAKRLVVETFFEEFKDTLAIGSDGSFEYETTKIKAPLTLKLHTDKLTFYAFLAPGYDLKINGNGLDYYTFINTISYSGLGSKSNAYWKDVMQALQRDTLNWINKEPKSYLAYLLKKRSMDSGIIAKHFSIDNQELYCN